MTIDQSTVVTPDCDERRKQLRQLEHDLKGYLGVVTMGLMALEGARDNPVEFSELKKTIDEGGIQPLKDAVAKMVRLANDR